MTTILRGADEAAVARWVLSSNISTAEAAVADASTSAQLDAIAEQLDALYPLGNITPLDKGEVITRTRALLDRGANERPKLNDTFTLPAMNSAIVGVYRDLLAAREARAPS